MSEDGTAIPRRRSRAARGEPQEPRKITTEAPAPVAAPLVARRGAQWLDETDLRAHLASLFRLENVSALLGSGASAGPLGGQTIAALWRTFQTDYAASLSWLLSEKFIADTTTAPNLEALADTLGIALQEWTRSGSSKLGALKSALADLKRAVIRAAILKREWWIDRRGPLTGRELLGHRQLLQKLVGARQPGQPSPWLFTTNYDLAIEWAAESVGVRLTTGFEGLHSRTFAPRSFDLDLHHTKSVGEARFGTYGVYLGKLHGSLTWRENDSKEVEELSSQVAWQVLEPFADGTTSDLQNYLVLPSAAKYSQTLGFVYGEQFRRFSDVLGAAQTCLITCGYSFGDPHINRFILSALQNPTLQLVAYVPEFKRDSGSGDADASDCSQCVQTLTTWGSPQVTIVGGGARAYFSNLVDDLPDPAIYNEQLAQLRERIRSATELPSGGSA